MSLSRTKSQRVVDKILHSMATGMPLTEDTEEPDANQRLINSSFLRELQLLAGCSAESEAAIENFRTSERKPPPSPKVTLNLGMPRLLRSTSVDHSLDSAAGTSAFLSARHKLEVLCRISNILMIKINPAISSYL